MFKISNLKIREDLSDYEVFKIAIKKNKIDENDILEWYISKKSIDARKKEDIYYNYSINLNIKNKQKYKFLEEIKDFEMPHINIKNTFTNPPIIIGAGPAGLFSALILIQNNIAPILIEQGEKVEERCETVNHFVQRGELNQYSNVQFGEGGAGTFSDGKLTTGIHSPFCKKVLQEFVNFGAPKEILYLSKPHLGTDNLVNIVKNIRKYIISQGGIFLFNTKAIDFEISNNKIKSVITKNIKTLTEDKINTDSVILAIGHSSRDTFEKLYERGFLMKKKNFSVGVRIEHLQNSINKAQYGLNPKLHLPPADYKLTYHSPNGRTCYTFCMCPGGRVIASSSEKNTIVTNGMSNYLRNETNANSAVLVSVTPDDFSDSNVLSGINFQKELEKKAFKLGGSNYFAPIQRLEDFINNQKSEFIGKIVPSYTPGTTLSNLNEILPLFISETLKKGIRFFDTKLKRFCR